MQINFIFAKAYFLHKLNLLSTINIKSHTENLLIFSFEGSSIFMKVTLTILLIVSSIIQYAPPQAIAQNRKPATTKKPVPQPSRKPRSRKKPSRPVFVPPKPPKGLTSIPGRKTGMGSRDNCPAVSKPLTALAPQTPQQNKSNTGIVGGLTTLERPYFLFYVPYTQNLTGSSAEFSLLDSKGMDVHRQKTALPAQPGIVRIPLPNTVALQPGQDYRWYFKIRCSNKKASIPIYVAGYIQRNKLDYRIQEQLKAANPQQKATIYAQKGIWFDALSTLAQLRKSSQNPSVEQDWQILLQSVDLENISTEPLMN